VREKRLTGPFIFGDRSLLGHTILDGSQLVLLIANDQIDQLARKHLEKYVEREETMKITEIWPILLIASLGLTSSVQAQWTKEQAAERARLEHLTNYQIMADLVQNPRSNLSGSTTQEIIRLAQLDAIAFAKRHRKISMEEAAKIGDSRAQMHQLENRFGLEAINAIDLSDRTAESDYAATFLRSLALIYEVKDVRGDTMDRTIDDGSPDIRNVGKPPVSDESFDLSTFAGDIKGLKELGKDDAASYSQQHGSIVDPLKVGWHRAQMHYLRGNDAKSYANGFAAAIDPNGAFYP
jgi:hypothetical protein